MSQQLSKGTTFTNTTPGNQVTATNLNALVDAATLTNGAVIDQNDVNTRGGNALTLAADTVLLGDSTQPDTAAPLKVPLSLLLLESQRNGTSQFDPAAASAGTLGAAYTVTLSPAATAYSGGMLVRFKADATNAGAVTVNVNGIGAQSVKNRIGSALAAGDLTVGQIVELVYDAGNGWFVLQASTPANSVASTQLTEAVRDGTYMYQSSVTVHSTSAGYDIYSVTLATMPTINGYVAGLRMKFLVPAAGTNSLGQSKLTMTGVSSSVQVPILKKGTLLLLPGDLPAGMVVEVVYDGTNFQLQNPATQWDYISALPGTNCPAASAVTTFAHGLGVAPTRVRVVLVQTNGTPQYGYNQNDVIPLEMLQGSSGIVPPLSVAIDATNVSIIGSNYASAIYCAHKTTGANTNIIAGVVSPFYFKLIVYAAL